VVIDIKSDNNLGRHLNPRKSRPYSSRASQQTSKRHTTVLFTTTQHTPQSAEPVSHTETTSFTQHKTQHRIINRLHTLHNITLLPKNCATKLTLDGSSNTPESAEKAPDTEKQYKQIQNEIKNNLLGLEKVLSDADTMKLTG
jgi:hypothetical protein